MPDRELIGVVSLEEIFRACPDWRTATASYRPNSKAVSNLRKKSASGIFVEIFFGVWCPDSKYRISEYAAVLEAAGNPLIRNIFIGLPRNRESRASYTEGRDIRKIPTFVVSRDGHEKGRIIEIPIKTVEEDLVEILS
jgi:hypothetical protein